MGKARKDRGGPDGRTLAVNRTARRNFEVEETFEVGIALLGTEVKAAREGRIQLKDAFARVRDGEVWLHRCHIGPYSHARENHEAERPRKLLMHSWQIRRLIGKTERAGYTLVPLRVYLKGPWIKIELALARGRERHQRKEELKRRIVERELRRAASRSRS